MSELPQELIDAIIGQVDNETSLKSCSIAARHFVSPSQQAIFRSLAPSRDQCEALQARLVASPHLAPYIQELAIFFPREDGEKRAVLFILHSLPNLRTLDFGSRLWSQQVIEALETLIAQPSLRHLTIYGAYDITPSFILRTVSSVSFFSIALFNLDADEASLISVPEFPVEFRAPLTHLVVRREYSEGPTLADVLLSAPASLVNLERLYVEIGEPQRLLLAVAPTLQYLRIQDVNVSSNSPVILPPPPPHLHTLEITIVISDDGTAPSHLPSVFGILADNLPNLEVIVLHCQISPDPPDPPSPPLTRQFPRLREVRCMIAGPLYGDRCCAALEETIPALQGLTNWQQ
ncbi:hypothetical protein C8J57DRAFT_433118 [Mycena rebaudengoi]|nr:hypothetical protein C8J57DRAFT_433118 [Mycena rebaudengoi]